MDIRSDTVIDVIDGQSFPRADHVGCPLCGHQHPSRPIAVANDMVAYVAVCDPCRLAYQTPRPSPDATLAYMNWRWKSTDTYVDDTKAQLARASQQLGFIRACGVQRGTLLDFGAGAGSFVRSALDVGWDAVGVERSDSARAKARERYGVTLLETVPQSEYDVITLWDVIEHLRAPSDMLQMLRPHLKPGGLIIIETGNWENWMRIANCDKWHVYLFDHHFYFSPASLERVLESSGYEDFEILDVNRNKPAGVVGLRSMPGYTLRSWAAWAAAMIRWPRHGDIKTLIATARRPQ